MASSTRAGARRFLGARREPAFVQTPPRASLAWAPNSPPFWKGAAFLRPPSRSFFSTKPLAAAQAGMSAGDSKTEPVARSSSGGSAAKCG